MRAVAMVVGAELRSGARVRATGGMAQLIASRTRRMGMFFLVLCILLAVVYLAYRAFLVSRSQEALATFLDAELKQIREAQRVPPEQLSYGWYDDGWPFRKTVQEDRAPLENPTPHKDPDDYETQMLIAEYRSILDPQQRKEFLRKLRKHGVWMRPTLLDLIYADENPLVRAWAAGHLETGFEDYTALRSMTEQEFVEYRLRHKPQKIRDYEPDLLGDPEPIVRAALWCNPDCSRLPWSGIFISEQWKDQLKSMSQLERLGLMRNPELPLRLVVALLETPSAQINMTREQHAEVLCAAAANADLVGSSRHTGRRGWVGGGEGNSPFEGFGTMWSLCLDKWMDQPSVPFCFFRYIQTTPEVKLAVYNRLLEKRDGSDRDWLRKEIIESCDPFDDSAVLRAAWNDPDEKCKEAARERVGSFSSFVGVNER